MQKRFLVPFCLLCNPISLIFGTAYIGNTAITNNIDACNGGDKEICVELAQKHGTDFNRADEISNPAYQAAIKPIAEAKAKAEADKAKAKAKAEADKAKADAEAKAKRANTFLPVEQRVAAAHSNGLVRKCENSYIKPALKDPNSYQHLGHNFVAQGQRGIDVVVRYTATNSFGGRVQNVQTCTYTLS